MCTLILAWQVFDDAPVALAANRDEALDRSAEPPTIRGDDARYVAPRDAEAGGTWIGLSESGVAVAVTNRWLDTEREGDRSRGLLVRDCLQADSADAAVRAVENDLETRSYDGFNLVIADAVAAFVLSYDGRLTVTQLEPGVHVVGNVGGVVNGSEQFTIPAHRHEFGLERANSAKRITAETVPLPGESGDAWLDRARDVLADHAYGACLHGDEFGTRSFTQMRFGADFGVVSEFAYAAGPPCETSAKTIPLPAGFGESRE